MKRLQRAVIAILCVVCLAFGMIACGEDDDKKPSDKVTYTVTVNAGSGVTGTVMRGVTVKLLNADGTEAAAAKELTLNSDRTQGTAKFSLKKGDYTVEIGNIVGLYVQGSIALTATVTKTTLTVTDQAPPAPKTTYKVLFQLPDGTAVPNTDVQICGGTPMQCHPATTDANGWATWEQPAGDYEIHVPSDNWPEGYYFDDTAYTLSATTVETTVKFRAYEQYKVTFKYGTNYVTTSYMGYEEGAVAAGVKFDVYAHTDANGGGKIGDKLLTVTTDENGVAEFKGPSICEFDNVIDTAGCVVGEESSRVLEPVTVSERTIVLHKPGIAPCAPIALKLDEAQTVAYTAESSDVWYKFVTDRSGVYTFTSTGDGAKNVRMYNCTASMVNLYYDVIAAVKENPANSEDVVFAEADNNFTVTVTIADEFAGPENSVYFAVGANGATANGEFTVTLARTGDYVPPKVPDVENVEPKQMIAAEDMPAIPEESTFEFLSNGYYEDSSLVKDADGIYHLYTADGDIVYASFGGKYSPDIFFNGGGFAQAILESGGIGFTFSDGKTYNKNYIDFVNAYVAGCNADGLHPLNDEIKEFLDYYIRSNTPGGTYKLASGYYKPKYTEVVDDGSGNYVMASFDDYKIEVAAKSSVKIANNVPKLGTMQQEDAKITLITEDANVTLSLNETPTDEEKSRSLVVGGGQPFYIHNAGANAVSVKFNSFYDTADININAVGTYTLKAFGGSGMTTYVFTAPENGVYTFEYDGDMYNAEIMDAEEYSYSSAVELKAGDKLSITIIPYDDMDEGVAEFTIAKPTLAASLVMGNNANVLVKNEECKYTFTAPADGNYVFTPSSKACWAAKMDGGVLVEISEPVALKAGDTLEVYICAYGALVCDVTVGTGDVGDVVIKAKPGSELKVGQTYEVEANGDGVSYTFTPTEAGTYVFTTSGNNAVLSYDDGTGAVDITEISNCVANEEYTFVCYTVNWQKDSYELTITKKAEATE